MNNRTYLLVIEDESGPNTVRTLHGALGLQSGDAVYHIDDGTKVVRTALPIDVLTTRLNESFTSFFITDITKSDRAGKMHPRFWDFLREDEKVAAE